MTTASTRLAALAIGISAVLHLVAPVFGGMSSMALLLLGVAPIYALFALGLLRGMRWLSYLVFVVLLIGAVFAFVASYGAGPVPSWLFTAIVLADLAALVGLFISLWQAKPSAVSA